MKQNLTSEQFEKHFGVQLPTRLANFYNLGEYNKYKNLTFTKSLPGYSFDYPFIPDINPKKLFKLFDDRGIKKLDGKSFIPFIHFISEIDFLATEISDLNCPVYFWTHGSGNFIKLTSSLDEFLETYYQKSPEQLLYQGLEVLRKALLENSVNTLNELINDQSIEEIFKSKTKFSQREYELESRLSEFYRLKGLIFLQLSNFIDAEKYFKLSINLSNILSPFCLLEVYRKTNEHSKTRELIKLIEDDPLMIGTKSIEFAYNYKLIQLIRVNATKDEIESLKNSLVNSAAKNDLKKLIQQEIENNKVETEEIKSFEVILNQLL